MNLYFCFCFSCDHGLGCNKYTQLPFVVAVVVDFEQHVVREKT